MSERTIPTAPGWWWADVDGWRELVHVRDPWGRSLEFLFDCEEYSVDDERLISGHVSEADGVFPCVVWLAPVATLEEVETLREQVDSLRDEAEALRALAQPPTPGQRSTGGYHLPSDVTTLICGGVEIGDIPMSASGRIVEALNLGAALAGEVEALRRDLKTLTQATIAAVGSGSIDPLITPAIEATILRSINSTGLGGPHE